MMQEISLDFWSILILLGIVHGWLFSVLLFKQKGKQTPSNILLGILILSLTWLQAEFFSVRTTLEIPLKHFYGTRYGSWLVIGPLIYMYIKSYNNREFAFKKRYVLHFIPFLVFAVIIPAFSQNLIPARGIHYGMLAVIKFPSRGLTFLQGLYGAIFLIQFIHAGLYVWLATRIPEKTSRDRNSKRLKRRLRWMRTFAISLGVILISSIFYLIILFYSDFYARWMDYLYIIPVTLFIYIVSYKVINEPEIIRSDIKILKSSDKYEKSSLTTDQSKQYLELLLKYMKEEKPYLDTDIKLGNLAEKLSLPHHHLSQVINQELQSNFYDFINKYRVEEAKNKLKIKSDRGSLLEVAYEVGFNNKASFNNYFKRFTGQTPSEFIRNSE